ncbi:5-oxoprolinase subunit PxpA [Rhodobacteraceae bacterium NNCM2]|nr:5-oxoprolinase subunit PxpA [Coraliihabitans acroporae]
MKICINADMGEGFGKYRIGNDAALMPLIDSANIACGMHAGDPTVMVETVELALRNGTSIGAHPGFNDIWGFGRRAMMMNPRDLEYMVTYQIGALQAIAGSRGAKVCHVKPHGALNNLAHSEPEVADAVARGIRAADPNLVFFANCTSEMTRAGEAVGLTVANEAYVDRPYDETGKMLSRTREDAVITDASQAAAHVMRMLEAGGIVTQGGRVIPVRIDTFCIHGDEPTAVALATELSATLDQRGVKRSPIVDLFAA